MSEDPRPTDPVAEALEAYIEQEREAHARAADGIGRAVLHPLGERLRAVAEAHAARLEALRGGPASAEDADLASLRAAVLGYRRGVVDDVLRPLCAELAELDCGEAVAGARAALIEDLSARVTDTGHRLERREPEALYARDPEDSSLRTIGKALVRADRGTRAWLTRVADRLRAVAGRPPAVVPERTQAVPFRLLVRYHAQVRLPDVRTAGIGAVQASLGAAFAGLEVATSDWLHTVVGLESSLDAAHTPTAADASAPDADSPVPERADPREAVRDGIAAAARFQAALGSATDSLVAPDFSDLLAAIEDDLRDDVLRAGSFMVREDQRQAPAQEARADRDAAAANAAWSAWHRQAVARLRLDIAIADFRETLVRRRADLASMLENDLARTIDEWLADTAGALGELRDAVERGCTSARAAGDASALRVQLRSVEEQACEILRREGPHHLSAGDAGHVSRTAAVACVDGILEAIRGNDATVTLHERPVAGVAVQPSRRTVRVRVREMAEQAFDVVLLERIRTSTQPADEVFAAVLTESRGLEDVIRFNLGAALDEIDAEGPADAQLDGAEELALNGLDRSVGALAAMRGRVREGVEQAERAARLAFQSGWDRFHDRVRVEDRVQDQLLDLGYRLRFVLREAGVRARHRVERIARDALARVRTGQSRALQLLRLGQAVVEGGRVSIEERRATVDALTSIGTVLAGLPLVYRRLFSLQPVEDPALVVGRSADLDAVREHFEHWRMGITDALLITGGAGSGRTSLLNVVRETILDGSAVHSVTLRERCLEEETFIRLLAAGLPAACAGITTFAALVDALRNTEPGGPPRVIIVEGLEHALLRTAGGNGLLGRIFSLLSTTDSNIFWLGTMGRAAWDYIERTEPLTPGLVRHYPLSALTREPLEEIVMRRHARSGLPIVFESPTAPMPVFRRRLRRARNEVQRQGILRAEFFDRLHRAAGQNVTLALFYWLRSASVDPATGTLYARALEPLNFGFLGELSLPQCFALKAFLDHGSLTLDEYEVVLGVRRSDAREMFESLGNQLLIEPTAQDNALADFRFNTIADASRYRIRPLVVHPVTRHLRGRNLLLSDA